MKILLVFPPFYLEPMYNMPPLGLIQLATTLKGSPHNVSIIDFPLAIRQKTLRLSKTIYEDCAARILEEKPDVVGFSVQCTTYPGALQIAGTLKAKQPEIKVIFGGHNASLVDERTLTAFPYVDAIIRGEGERTFPEVIAAYAMGQSEECIPGVTYRQGGHIVRNADRELIPCLDDLPLADYSYVAPLSEYRDRCNIRRSIAILEVGRGCPHHCIYCSQSLIWRRRSRLFSIERLVREMHHLHEEFGAECFLLAYDQFTAKRDFVEDFCRRVIEEGLRHIPWYCISRLDSLDAPLLRLMREAGCESMCAGIDSGSKRTLAFIRKNIDHKILYQRVQETTAQGIIPTLSFVIGFPEEEREDIEETLGLALRTSILGNVNPLIQMATILPGTDLHTRYADWLVREVDTYFSLGTEFENGKRLVSDEAMINSDPVLFSSFYNLPCPGESLRNLNLLANGFPVLMSTYPRTLLLLKEELGIPLIDLFFRFLEWLNRRLERPDSSLSPRECYQHFGPFVREMFSPKEGTLRFPHLPDLLRYESCSIEAGQFALSESPFTIDLNRMRSWKPHRSSAALLREFDFPLPQIIAELKAEVLREDYLPETTILIFKQQGDRLLVEQINDFGRDFLALCNGTRTLEAIGDELYGRYGTCHTPEAFMESCTEAAKVLGRMQLLRNVPSQT